MNAQQRCKKLSYVSLHLAQIRFSSIGSAPDLKDLTGKVSHQLAIICTNAVVGIPYLPDKADFHARWA
jgi:hypothetical protein